MIKIESVTIKKTKSGKDYKNLKLSDGKFVNMWNDDIDYSIAETGATLDRDLEQQGKFWNLLPKGSKPLPKSETNNVLLEAMLASLVRIEKHLGTTPEVEMKTEEEKKIDEIYDDIDEDIDPADIPF